MPEVWLAWDREAFLYLNGLGTPVWDGFWLALSGTWTALPLYLVLLVWSLKEYGWKRSLLLLAFVALLITCTDQLSNFFKYGLARPRPCYDPGLDPYIRLVKASCGGPYGFFSAHAANAMGPAVFFTVLFGPGRRIWGGLLLVWAVAVGYSRIYLGVHYPGDVLAGFLAGAFFGWLFARLFRMGLNKWRL